MRIRLLEALCAALTLAGCATTSNVTPPAPDVVTADPGVPTACVTTIPARPALSSEAEWARTPDDPDMRVRTLKADRRTLLQHVAKLEATLAACKTDAATAP